ncbi:MAG: polysaccharide biosynthesis/export family protein [Xanthomonadales bacterium]|jgi:polysaccharide export outer membrane protein|nr:polysaccharide biosynthesis/export family protein [Xanthomonadales bacterium]
MTGPDILQRVLKAFGHRAPATREPTGNPCRALVPTIGLLVAFTLAGIAPLAHGQGAGNAAASQWGPLMEYRIGPSDVLSIRVRGHEGLSQTVTVRPDGKLSFALVGDLDAAGMTPAELQKSVEAALGKFINILPGEVTVIVDAVHSYKVSVLGEVKDPGRFEFQIRVSVLDALAQAGGLTEFADSSDIVIFRTFGGKEEKLEFNYDRLVKADGTAAWVPVLPGDIILVP